MMRYNTIILCVIVEVGDMRRSGRIAAGLFLAAMLFAAGCGAAASEPAAPLPPAPSAPLPDGIPEPVRRALARTEERRGRTELIAVSVTPSGEGLAVLLCVRAGEGVCARPLPLAGRAPAGGINRPKRAAAAGKSRRPPRCSMGE